MFTDCKCLIMQLTDLMLPHSQTHSWNPSPCQADGINLTDLTGVKNTSRTTDINKVTNIHNKTCHEQSLKENQKKSDFQVIFHWKRTANTHKCFCARVCVYAHTFTYTFISGVLLKLDNKVKVVTVQKLMMSEQQQVCRVYLHHSAVCYWSLLVSVLESQSLE